MNYLLKRVLLGLLNLWALSFFCFCLLEGLPGGPVEEMILALKLEQAELGIELSSEEDLYAEIEQDLGLDQPFLSRYFLWMQGLTRFSFGESRVYRIEVLQLIKEKVNVSIFFGLSAVFWGGLFGLALGFLRAVYKEKKFDEWALFISLGLYAVPVLVLALLLRMFLAGELGWAIFPIGGSSLGEGQISWIKLAHQSVLPGFCFGLPHIIFNSFLLRNSLIEEESKTYFQAAKAKGLTRNRALFHHALRSAMVPLVAQFGSYFSLFVSGAIVLEQVFNLDGVGLLTYRSVLNHDFNVVLALVMIASALYILGRFLSDLCLAALDPRISLEPEKQR